MGLMGREDNEWVKSGPTGLIRRVERLERRLAKMEREAVRYDELEPGALRPQPATATDERAG